MKYISWNINGYRAWVKKEGAVKFLLSEDPDIICFQETKAHTEKIKESVIETFTRWPYQYFFQATKPGYSSTLLMSKTEPLSVEYGIPSIPISIDEGRVITAQYNDHYIVNVYTPNSKPDLARVKFRYQEWDVKFLKFIQKLEKKKPVIVCGDLNVAPTEIDLKNDKTNRTNNTFPGNPGATDREREGFSNYLNAGFIDSWRHQHPSIRKYSWWSYRSNARPNNSGWRIDFFLISQLLQNHIKDTEIYDQIHGSDHCPVSLQLK